MSITNATAVLDVVNKGPYYARYDAGRVIDILYLTIVSVIGTFGNLTVILSIIHGRRLTKNGNIFIINLAIADFIVTAFFVPTVIANVILTTNALSTTACHAAGYLLTVFSGCSACNLGFIAFNRYWYVVRHHSYKQLFSTRILCMMAVLTWVWTNLFTMPTLLGWTNLAYDNKMLLCTYDDARSISYSIFVMLLAICLPISITAICYWRLFATVSRRRAKLRRRSSPSHFNIKSMEQRRLAKQLDLAKTLTVTVLVFVFCLTPYGICILLDQNYINPLAKRIAGRLVLTNSAVNFIIYGAMNPIYRRAYIALWKYIFCCKKGERSIVSTSNGVKHRPSYFAGTKRTEGNFVPTTQTFTTIVKQGLVSRDSPISSSKASDLNAK